MKQELIQQIMKTQAATDQFLEESVDFVMRKMAKDAECKFAKDFFAMCGGLPHFFATEVEFESPEQADSVQAQLQFFIRMARVGYAQTTGLVVSRWLESREEDHE